MACPGLELDPPDVLLGAGRSLSKLCASGGLNLVGSRETVVWDRLPGGLSEPRGQVTTPLGETARREEGPRRPSWVLPAGAERVASWLQVGGGSRWREPLMGAGAWPRGLPLPTLMGKRPDHPECSPPPLPQPLLSLAVPLGARWGLIPFPGLPCSPAAGSPCRPGSRALFLVCGPSPAPFPPLSDGCSLLGLFWEWDPTCRMLCPGQGRPYYALFFP